MGYPASLRNAVVDAAAGRATSTWSPTGSSGSAAAQPWKARCWSSRTSSNRTPDFRARSPWRRNWRVWWFTFPRPRVSHGCRSTRGAKQRARRSKFGGFNMAESLTGVPTISGLDESFDRIIRGLPQSFFRSGLGVLQPDDDTPDRISQLRDPFTVMGRVRDTVGGVVLRGADGTYAGLKIRNIFLHDLSKPHAVALSHAAVSEIGTDRNRFVNTEAYGAHAKAHGHTINTIDGADHRSLRRLFDSAIFGRRAMDEWTAAITRPTIVFLVERAKRMLAAGETPG